MPHDPRALLHDIVQAGALIQQFTAGRTLDEYSADAMCRSAVERQFLIVGEAMARLERLDATLARRITHYRQIVAFRNRLVHGYDVTTDNIVWGIVTSDLPALLAEVQHLLASLPDS